MDLPEKKAGALPKVRLAASFDERGGVIERLQGAGYQVEEVMRFIFCIPRAKK
ncbi:MAG: hypothetical protein ACPW60_10870 [Methylohalobius sp. ZOD2]